MEYQPRSLSPPPPTVTPPAPFCFFPFQTSQKASLSQESGFSNSHSLWVNCGRCVSPSFPHKLKIWLKPQLLLPAYRSTPKKFYFFLPLFPPIFTNPSAVPSPHRRRPCRAKPRCGGCRSGPGWGTTSGRSPRRRRPSGRARRAPCGAGPPTLAEGLWGWNGVGLGAEISCPSTREGSCGLQAARPGQAFGIFLHYTSFSFRGLLSGGCLRLWWGGPLSRLEVSPAHTRLLTM